MYTATVVELLGRCTACVRSNRSSEYCRIQM